MFKRNNDDCRLLVYANMKNKRINKKTMYEILATGLTLSFKTISKKYTNIM